MRACPTPRKRRYPDRIAAELALANIRRKDRQQMAERRAYRCPCGRWHLTARGDS